MIKKIIYLPFDFLIRIAKLYSNFVGKISNKNIQGKFFEKLINDYQDNIIDVHHKDKEGVIVNLKFFIPNEICKMRAQTFSTKEPEILEWVDEFGDEKPFWDIGSNIGLYSIYFAKKKKGKVVSFEPSFFNLKQLVKNINLNKLTEKIDIIPMPLSNSVGINKFILSNVEEGGSLNAFGVEYGIEGERLYQDTTYNVLGFSANELLDKGLITEIPKLIKIDVDGIEHLILDGMKKILSAKECKSIFVEVNDKFIEQSKNVNKVLEECGFSLHTKTSANIGNDPDLDFIKNQIWNKI